MKQFDVKRNGHEWLVTHCDTGISAFIPSRETQPKAVLLEVADDFVYWHEISREHGAEAIKCSKMKTTADFLFDIDYTLEDANRLQWELATEACADPERFYGGDE